MPASLIHFPLRVLGHNSPLSRSDRGESGTKSHDASPPTIEPSSKRIPVVSNNRGTINEQTAESLDPPGADFMTDRASSQPPTQGRPPETRLERIARRAREIYEARGGAHGKDLDDWLAAEREVDAEIEKESGTP